VEFFEGYGLPESQLESIRGCGSQDMAYGSRIPALLEKNKK